MAASTSMAATAALLPPRASTAAGSPRFSALPLLPPRRLSSQPARTFAKLNSEPRRFVQLQIRASSSDEAATEVDPNQLFTDLQEKWDALENKSTVLLYGGGAIVGVWLASTVVGAVNSIPLLPKIMELVGLGYTAWFVYRYLLFKSSRKDLAEDIEALKKKITGTE